MIDFKLLAYLLLIFSGALLGMIQYKRLEPAYQYLTQYLTGVFISEIASFWLYTQINTNYPVYHILLVFTLIYFGLIFRHLQQKFGNKKYRILPWAIALALVAVAVSVFFQDIYTFPSINLSLLSLFVVGNALFLFTGMIRNPVPTPIQRQPAFWFGTGSLFFYSITFFCYAYLEYFVIDYGPVAAWIYHIIQASNYILYASYLISIYFAAAQKTD